MSDVVTPAPDREIKCKDCEEKYEFLVADYDYQRRKKHWDNWRCQDCLALFTVKQAPKPKL